MGVIRARDRERLVNIATRIAEVQRLADDIIEAGIKTASDRVLYRSYMYKVYTYQKQLTALNKLTARTMTRNEVFATMTATMKREIEEFRVEADNVQKQLISMTNQFLHSSPDLSASEIKIISKERDKWLKMIAQKEDHLAKFVVRGPNGVYASKATHTRLDAENLTKVQSFSSGNYFESEVINPQIKNKPEDEIDTTTFDYTAILAGAKKAVSIEENTNEEEYKPTFRHAHEYEIAEHVMANSLLSLKELNEKIANKPKLATESGFALLGVKPDYNVQLRVEPTNDVETTEEQAPESAGENK